MKLKDFKEGDVIRHVPDKNAKDRSFSGGLIFLSYEKGILVYMYYDDFSLDEVYHNSMDMWDDDRWEHFPVETIEKYRKQKKQLQEKYNTQKVLDVFKGWEEKKERNKKKKGFLSRLFN